MKILDVEDTSASPYIMLLPLDIHNMCIKMQCIIIALLTYRLQQEISWEGRVCLISKKLQQDRTKPYGIVSCEKLLKVNHYPLTLKQRTRSPLTMVRHSEDSSGIDCWRIAFLTFIHSSSSAPNPLNLTRTSYNSNVEILGHIQEQQCSNIWLHKNATELKLLLYKQQRNNNEDHSALSLVFILRPTK
jgi:hypothetical protein